MYTIIAAIGKNRELGRDNKLLWSLKGDLKFFKEKTTNHTIIMGRKTFESLGRLLPNRKHVVISSSNNFPPEVKVYNNILTNIVRKIKFVPHLGWSLLCFFTFSTVSRCSFS